MSLIEVKKKLLMTQKGGADVSELFNTSLWTGNGASQTITTGIDSSEGSLVWGKSRSNTYANFLGDTFRGPNNFISSNTANAQSGRPNSLTGFSSDGYSLGSDTVLNGSGISVVGWQFRRAEKFFDIVQYVGNNVSNRKVNHALGTKPGMMIIKRVSSVGNWLVYHQSTGATQVGFLNTTGAFSGGGDWNSAEPTDSQFTVSAGNSANETGETYIAYLFAHDSSPEGIIQCGSYVGNGSATGPVVNLGWRPQYLMIKNATAAGDWILVDSAREIGANDPYLTANSTAAEVVTNLITPTGSGFQVVNDWSGVNANGHTYIYMAIRGVS